MRIRVHSRRCSGVAAACGVVVAMAVVAALPASAGYGAVQVAAGSPGTSAATAVAAGKQAQKWITGRLDKPGYTVIALASNGKASSTRVRDRSFRLRPPASRVTLHLRAPNGVYAGPIVVGKAQKGKRAIVGVKAGARLGKVKILRGYAGVLKELSSSRIDKKRWAKARKGIPIGAGNFGLRRSKPPHAAPPGDLDADGVPDKLDVDINGNLIMNNVDRAHTSLARAAQATSQFFIGNNQQAPLADNLNANATAVTDAQIDRTLSIWAFLGIGILPGNPELDCGGSPDPADPQGWIGGLSYCTRGGTGATRVLGPTPSSPLTDIPFPACCDADGDGYGELLDATGGNTAAAPTFSLIPRAKSSEIGTGDVLIQRVTSNGVTTDTPTLLPFIFATDPALVSYDDGQGNSPTFSYPISQPDLGTMGNELPVAAGPSGEVVAKFTFWRPQRKPIPPEPGDWTDIGKLRYGARIQGLGSSGSSQDCPQSSFSEDDPNLSPPETFNAATHTGGLTDLAPDMPANPANTITYTLNLTNCIAANGSAWTSGHTAVVRFTATDGFGLSVSEASTWAIFKLQ